MARGRLREPGVGSGRTSGRDYRQGVYALLQGVNTLQRGMGDMAEGLSPAARAKRAAAKAAADLEAKTSGLTSEEQDRAMREAGEGAAPGGFMSGAPRGPMEVASFAPSAAVLPGSTTPMLPSRGPGAPPPAPVASAPSQSAGILRALGLDIPNEMYEEPPLVTGPTPMTAPPPPPRPGLAAPPGAKAAGFLPLPKGSSPAPTGPGAAPRKSPFDPRARSRALRDRALALGRGDLNLAGDLRREAEDIGLREDPETVADEVLALGEAMKSREALDAFQPTTRAGRAAKAKALAQMGDEARTEAQRQVERTEKRTDLDEGRKYKEGQERDERIRTDLRRREVMQDQELLTTLKGLSPDDMKSKKPRFQSPEGWDGYLEMLGKSQAERDAFLARVGFARDPDDPTVLYEVVAGKGAPSEKPSVTQDQYIQDQTMQRKRRADRAKQDLDLLLDPVKGRASFADDAAYDAALATARQKHIAAVRDEESFDYDKAAEEWRTKYGSPKSRVAPGTKPAAPTKVEAPAAPAPAAPAPAPEVPSGSGEEEEAFLQRIERKAIDGKALTPEEEKRLKFIEDRKGGLGSPESKSRIIDERGEGGQFNPAEGPERARKFERRERAILKAGLDEATRKAKYTAILDGSYRKDLAGLTDEEREVAARREYDEDERRLKELLSPGVEMPKVDEAARRVAAAKEEARKAELLKVARKRRLGGVYDLIGAGAR